MKKSVLLGAMLSAVFAAMPAQNANAQATVVDDFGCGVIAADWGGAATLYTTDSHRVRTPSGNINFYCDFVIPPELNIGGPALKHDGFPCSTGWGLTTDTMAITDWYEGTVHLRCQFKANTKQ